MNGLATASRAKDRSDMWIHEGWANYSEVLFVEYMWGKKDALIYINTGKDKVKNESPVISEEGVFSTPPADQYKKGSLFLNTLRSVINDDDKWYSLLRNYYQHFKYRTIMTTDMVAFFNRHTGLQLRPIFDEYLRHAALPTLELRFDRLRTRFRIVGWPKKRSLPCRCAWDSKAPGRSLRPRPRGSA